MKNFLILVLFITISVQADELENYINYRAGIAEYKGDVKCATKYETQLRLLVNNPANKYSQKLTTISFSPPIRSDSLQTQHFTLHWDVIGLNAVPLEDISSNGIPDYIDTAAAVLEHVWEVEINQLNYSPPPQQNGQPVSTYHVYFSNMAYYGLTTGSGEDIASLPGINWTSYLELENDYQESYFFTKGLDGLRVTAAHEFHHAIQFGYNVRTNGQDFFFYEMTSTWMEDVLYNEINDYYNYLSTLFENLGVRSFDDYSLYSYGNCLYLHLLEKKYGKMIIQDIWNQIKSEPAINAIKSVLQKSPYNTSWVQSLSEYAVWLYYTGNRSNSVHYFPEGEFYPQINKNRFEVRNFSTNLDINTNVISNAAKYFKIYNVEYNVPLNLLLSSETAVEAGFVALSTAGSSGFYSINEILTNYQTTEDSIIFIISNANNMENTFSLVNLIPDRFKINQNYPNPFNNKTSILVELIDITRFSLKLYNGIGEQIRVLQREEIKPAGFYLYNWNGQNDQGRVVATGVYYAVFESNKTNKVIKMTFVK